MTSEAVQITEMLIEARGGDQNAANRLMEAVYTQLHGIARRAFAGERPDHTLQPTAVVNEAYLRIFHGARLEFTDRVKFFSFASLLMRRILIDHARHVRAVKLGGGLKFLLDENRAAAPDHEGNSHVHDLLERLERSDPEAGRVVAMKIFSGLTDDETAAAIGCNPAAVRRHWTFARSWLLQRLSEA